MTAEETTIGTCECLVCEREYDFEATGAEHSDECPECAARREAEEAREEAIEEMRGDLDTLESELADMLDQVKEKKAEIRDKKRQIAKLEGGR